MKTTRRAKDTTIWFYRSNTSRLDASTRWQYAGAFRPQCKKYGRSGDGCLAGGQGGLNFVTDCDGSLYLVNMDGEFTGNLGRRNDRHWYQVWRVFERANYIELTKVTQQRRRVGDRPQQTDSFRWGGHVYVDANGRIVMSSAERQTGGSFVNRSDGRFVQIRSTWAD